MLDLETILLLSKKDEAHARLSENSKPRTTSKALNSSNSIERKRKFLSKFDGTTYDYFFAGQTVNGKQNGFWHFKDGRICRVENSKLVRPACQSWKKAFIRTDCNHLRNAAFNRELDRIKHLVRYRGFDINCGPDTQSSVLLVALEEGAKGRTKYTASVVEIVKYLVENGADVHFRKKSDGLKYVTDNKSMSFNAAYLNQFEAAAYLVKNGGSYEDAEAGYQYRKSRDARTAAAWESFKGSVGEFFQKANKANEEERARLGVTAQLGVYKIDRDDNVTHIYCNRSPSVAHTMYRNKSGCFEPPSLTGSHDCSEVYESLLKRCE